MLAALRIDWISAVLAGLGGALGGLVLSGLLRTVVGRYHAALAETVHGNLADLFVFLEPQRIVQASVIALVTVPGTLWLATGHWLPAALAVGPVLLGPGLAHRWLRRRRLRALAHQLPDGLEALAGALKAGASLPQAIAGLADQQPRPLGQEFALLVRKQRLGMSLDQALAELEARVPGHEYALFVTAVRVARELGGNLAESLERLADRTRRKLAMEDRIEALTAQGRLQGWIVGALPLLLMAVLSWLEPAAMALLYSTAAGWAVLAVLATLLVAGAVLIRRIVTIDV